MKYMYVWDDWSLFHVEEVEVINEDFFSNGKTAVIKRGSGSMPVPRKYLFDTYEEAYQFGLTNVPKGIS